MYASAKFQNQIGMLATGSRYVNAARLSRSYEKDGLSAFNPHTETAALFIEASLTLLYHYRNATSKTCLVVAGSGFYSTITGRSVSGSLLRLIEQFADDMASDLPFFQADTPSSWIDICDGLYSNVARVKKSVLGAKIISVFNHLIAHTFYAKIGVEVDSKLFAQIEKNEIRPNVWQCLGFADAVVGLLLFLAKAGRQALLTGSVEAFFVDDVTITRWLDTASRLRKDAEFLSNPAALGTSVPIFMAQLTDAIDTGTKLSKVFKTGTQHTLINSVLLELEMVKKRHQASMLSASFRRAPFGLFLYGSPGVAKSFISSGLFNHYCSVRGVPKESAVCWTRDDNDDYYSGYKSHFMGVLYDDAGKFRPSAITGVDPSIKDIISAVNNIPFITNQAELQDKGKIPFLSEWVGVTSNIGDLNADQYYNSSGAFLRRLKVRITPYVKPEFCVEGQDKIDETKIPAGVQYPDCWTFDVCFPILKDKLRGEYDEANKLHFSCYADLLSFMTGQYEKHIAAQDKLMTTVGGMGPEALCACRVPKSICQCTVFGPFLADVTVPTTQAGEVESSYEDSLRISIRVGMALTLRRNMHTKYSGLTGSEAMFFHSLWKERRFLDLISTSETFDEEEDGDCMALEHFEKYVDTAMARFKLLTPRERLDELTESSFETKAPAVYLTFVPRPGKPCTFMREQLTYVKQQVMFFVEHTCSDSEMALLDAYIYEEAPGFIGQGWPMSDIVKGALDYIKFHSKLQVDQARLDAREMLLSDDSQVTWSQKLSVWFAVNYFERGWVRASTDFLVGVPGVCWFVRKCLSAKSVGFKESLASAGRAYDRSLGGSHPYIKVIVSVCAFAGLLAIAHRLIKRYKTKQEMQLETDEQMNLSEVGKLPIVRESERKNPWMVPERTITKFDVDPRRPHNGDQAVDALRNNLVYAQISFIDNGKRATAFCRMIVVTNNVIVANHHCVPDRCSIVVWMGPKTASGPQPAFKVEIDPDMLTRDPSRDLVFIKTRAMPAAFKAIRHLFPKRTYQSNGPAFYLKRSPEGVCTKLAVAGAVQRQFKDWPFAPAIDCKLWISEPEAPTVVGDCGSPLLVQSPLGTVIAGIHFAFTPGICRAYAVPIFFEDFDDTPMVRLGCIVTDSTLAQVGSTLDKTDKLFTDYHQEGMMLVHGALRGFRPRPKFSGKKTPFADYVLGRAHEFSPRITDRLAPPKASSWVGQQLTLSTYMKPTHSINESIFRACKDAFVEHIEAHLSDVDWADIHPVPIEVAVNGYPGVPNVDAMKFTTSGGHGFRGAKLQFLTDAEKNGVWEHFRELTPECLKKVEDLRDKVSQGIRPHSIYTSVPKDEFLSRAKVDAGVMRSIYMVPMDFLINSRMSTMGMTRVMVRHRNVFGIAVGLNTHSEEWEEKMALGDTIPGDNWSAGDVKNFEAALSLVVSNYVCDIFEHMAVRSGNYSSEEMLILRTLLADMSSACVDFYGTLITLLGGEVSGHALTTFFNCLANQLLHIYAYVLVHIGDKACYDQALRVAREWFIMVFRDTLGDDVYLKVHPNRPLYNHTTIQQVFANIGIVYTMADKLAVSVPYIPLKEVTFLKRSTVSHSAFPGVRMAALDRESIYKMLLYTIPSKSASQEEQFASAFASAQAEAFFHDRQFFDQVSELIRDIPKSAELAARCRDFPPPTWDVMVQRFISASPKIQAKLLVPGDVAETMQPEDSYCHPPDMQMQAGWSVDPWGSTTMGRSPEDRIHGGLRLSPNISAIPRRTVAHGVGERFHHSKNSIVNNTSDTLAQTEMTRPDCVKVINKLHNKNLRRVRRKYWERTKYQADFQYDTATMPTPESSPATDVVQQTTVFKNEPVSRVVDVTGGKSALTKPLNMTQSLGEYLSRPKQIYTYAWSENGADGFKASFRPWFEFFTDANMRAKLRGFSMLSCDLHLKFLVNGSPFYYGSMIAAYTPLSGVRTDTVLSAAANVALVPTSQKPHVWLENQNMSSVQMKLPFLYPYPYMDIASVTTLQDFGDISLWQYAPLLSANGTGTANIDIQVYAWAENVKLSGPTDLTILQSGFKEESESHWYDKFKPDGQISGACAAIGGMAAAASCIPELAPYTTGIAENAAMIGSAAAIFGYTNTPNIQDVRPVKQVPFQLATSEISEPAMKLSLQPKQGISVGGTQHGGDNKEDLVLKHFAGRSSFLVASDWLTTQVPGDVLFTSAISPALFQRTPTQIAHTPLSWMANHFQYWRGSIKFTFKLVRSPYHRGRLQISWDRLATNLNQGPTVGNPNTYTTIMDLDEDSEASFTVPYMQVQQFLKTYAILDTGSPIWSTATAPSGSFLRANGVLSVRVVNRLTAPEPSSAARLLIFVNAEDDIEFAAPREFEVFSGNNILSLSNLTTSVLQSDVVYDDEAEAHEFAISKTPPKVYLECFGERVVSMREVLHRSSLSTNWMSKSGDAIAGLGEVNIPLKRVPPAPGVYNNAWTIGTTGSGAGQRVFYTKFHPILSMGSCFVGYKGSVNITVNVDQASNALATDTLGIDRIQNADVLASAFRRPVLSLYGNQANDSLNTRSINRTGSGRAGRALTNTKTNTGLVANIPYYANSGFLTFNMFNEYSNNEVLADNNNDWWQVFWRFNKNAQTNLDPANTAIYYATGPDFDLIFFVCVPVLFSQTITTV